MPTLTRVIVVGLTVLVIVGGALLLATVRELRLPTVVPDRAACVAAPCPVCARCNDVELQPVTVAALLRPLLPPNATVCDATRSAPAGRSCDAIIVKTVAMVGPALARLREGQLVVVDGPLLQSPNDAKVWDQLIDEHVLETVLSAQGALAVHVARKTAPIANFALDAFHKDRASADYISANSSLECYAFVAILPIEDSFHDLFRTAIHRLRLLDTTRDVVVFLIASDEHAAAAAAVAPAYRRLGARVLLRRPLPIRDFDKNFYYKFDYQKLYLWNLRYARVMFLDGDIIVQASPAQAWTLCVQRVDRPICAVQEEGKWGGYFNNGMFIFSPAWGGAAELFRSWFKPNAPWRQICLQDVMNEVYAQRWIPLPLAFNHQGLKREKWTETDDAKVVHYKECWAGNKFPACAKYLAYREAMKKSLAA